MRIGFFGTPGIAAYALEHLSAHFEIAFLVTGDDKPSGRHLQLKCSPAKETARGHHIDVLHPKSLRDEAFISALKSFNADIFVVVAYGRLIPREVFTLPRFGTINLHPSLLPRYRGAAPIEWAIMRGESGTGVTVQLINERLDAGDIVLQKEIPLSDSITAGELYEIVKPAGAQLLVESIRMIESGNAVPEVQDEAQASYCGKIDKETSRIDWTKSSGEINNLVRGLNPKPGAMTGFRDMLFKIWKTAPLAEAAPCAPAPGVMFVHQKKRLLVGTGSGFIEVLSLQPERKKVMDAASFINGYRLSADAQFGTRPSGR
jgi:methionyl-tRNA formyltransferase